jgi:hypothetical protein
MRVDVYRLMHEYEPWMQAPAARRKYFAIYAGDLVRLHIVLIMRHAVDPRMRNRIAGFVFSSHSAAL